MFKCKVCAEKDARIADLKAQIAYISSLVFPSNNGLLPTINVEANRLLDGGHEEGDTEHSELDEVAAEAARMLTGNF